MADGKADNGVQVIRFTILPGDAGLFHRPEFKNILGPLD